MRKGKKVGIKKHLEKTKYFFESKENLNKITYSL
jgi:hypothetical protein